MQIWYMRMQTRRHGAALLSVKLCWPTLLDGRIEIMNGNFLSATFNDIRQYQYQSAKQYIALGPYRTVATSVGDHKQKLRRSLKASCNHEMPWGCPGSTYFLSALRFEGNGLKNHTIIE